MSMAIQRVSPGNPNRRNVMDKPKHHKKYRVMANVTQLAESDALEDAIAFAKQYAKVHPGTVNIVDANGAEVGFSTPDGKVTIN